MKIFIIYSFVAVMVVFLAIGFFNSSPVFAVAATAPNLGTAASFSVFAGSAMTADGSGATVSADLGVNPGLSVSGPWTVGGSSYFGTSGLSGTAKTDATAAWTSMGSTGGTTWDPAVPADMTPAPGLYTRAGDATITTTLTLNGSASDVWIFQISDSLTFTDAATVNLTGGASACNVYWRIASSATINGAPGKTFAGTLIANSNVSLVTGATVVGRMMALTGTLSTAGVTNISGCASSTVAPSSSRAIATINVVKTVINDNGRTKVVADFPLFVNGTPVVSGITNTFPAPASVYTVTETSDSNYSRVFSGDCDMNGQLNLNPGDNKFCIVTNNDIGAPVIVPPVPPLIDVIKVPNPLALPSGPGSVTYTYTLRNIGTVPVTDVTMVGDTCSPIVLISGDTNSDSKIDVTEAWTYHCTTTLTETHTNTVVATGWANGISAVDIASATVAVGVPIVPPLIHVTKIPSPLTLLAGGGMITYTNKVTNPGAVALSNVRLIDNKCSPVRYISGDTNGDSKLDASETWIYTCQANLNQTTTNTVIASGDANGLTARDFAIATVVVAVPVTSLPRIGLFDDKNSASNIVILASILMLVSASLVVALRKRTI